MILLSQRASIQDLCQIGKEGQQKPGHSSQWFQLQTSQSLILSISEDHHFLQVKSFSVMLTCDMPKIEEFTHQRFFHLTDHTENRFCSVIQNKEKLVYKVKKSSIRCSTIFK